MKDEDMRFGKIIIQYEDTDGDYEVYVSVSSYYKSKLKAWKKFEIINQYEATKVWEDTRVKQ